MSTSMRFRHRLPAYSLGVQGSLVLLAGCYGLVRPIAFIEQGLGVSSSALGTVALLQLAHASSLQLITMGTYFCLAARYPAMWRVASTVNVPLRLLAAFLFWQDGPKARSVAWWELLWAAINGGVAYMATDV